MNRRSFLSSLLTLAVAPQILTRVLPDAFKWKKTASGLFVINPAWVAAQYEMAWIVTEKSYYQIFDRTKWEEHMGRINKDPQMFPLRFKNIDGTEAEIIKSAIPPFKLV